MTETKQQQEILGKKELEYCQQIPRDTRNFQACGETVRLVSTCTKKRVSKKQESPATLR